MEKPLKYKELLQQSAQERESQDLQFVVENAKLQLQSDKLATQQKVSELTRKVNDLKRAEPISFQAILSAQDELRGYIEGLARLEDLEKELF